MYNIPKLNKLIKSRVYDKAEFISNKVKREIRNEFEATLKDEVYNSYGPIQESGKTIAKYNETHKHKIARPYHHTGILIKAIHGKIEGDYIGIVFTGNYPATNSHEDPIPAKKVYDWLRKGTKPSQKYDHYILNGYRSGTPFVRYVRTPKHNFEQKTMLKMDAYLKTLSEKISRNPENYGM